MSKTILSKKDKEVELLRFLQSDVLPEIRDNITKKIAAALASGSVPEYMMEEGNYSLLKACVDSFCLDRPFRLLSTEVKKDAANIHKFI